MKQLYHVINWELYRDYENDSSLSSGHDLAVLAVQDHDGTLGACCINEEIEPVAKDGQGEVTLYGYPFEQNKFLYV